MSRRTLTASVLAGSLLLAACSGSGDGRSTSAETPGGADGTSGASAPESDKAEGSGADTGTGSGSHGSGDPSASGSSATSDSPGSSSSPAGSFSADVADKLGRATVPDSEMTGPGGSTGSWKGADIGVLTKGEDTTLVVREGTRWKIVGGWWPSKDLPGPYLGGKRHVLAIGSDARPHEKVSRTRADAIQIVGLDGTGGGGILGIPRDTRAALSTGGTGKVNAAMAYGGPKAQVSTVSRLTGLPLKGYVLTSMAGFVATVDAMGGVEITLDRQIRELKPGRQKLDGKQLLRVARERKTLPRGDIDRSSNQGLVMMAVLSTMRKRGIDDLPGMLSKTGKHVETDLSAAQVLTLFAAGYALSPTRVGGAVADTVPAGNDLALTSEAKSTFTKFADGNL